METAALMVLTLLAVLPGIDISKVRKHVWMYICLFLTVMCYVARSSVSGGHTRIM